MFQSDEYADREIFEIVLHTLCRLRIGIPLSALLPTLVELTKVDDGLFDATLTQVCEDFDHKVHPEDRAMFVTRLT